MPYSVTSIFEIIVNHLFSEIGQTIVIHYFGDIHWKKYFRKWEGCYVVMKVLTNIMKMYYFCWGKQLIC